MPSTVFCQGEMEIIILLLLKVSFVVQKSPASEFCKQSCFYSASLGNTLITYFLCSEWNKDRLSVVQENRWDMKLWKVLAYLEKERLEFGWFIGFKINLKQKD